MTKREGTDIKGWLLAGVFTVTLWAVLAALFYYLGDLRAGLFIIGIFIFAFALIGAWLYIRQQAIYDEGWLAFELGISEHSNPYTGLDAEYWSDGYEDALEGRRDNWRVKTGVYRDTKTHLRNEDALEDDAQR